MRNEEMCRERSAGRLRPSCGSGPGPAPGQGDGPRLWPPGPPTRRAPAPRITRPCRCRFRPPAAAGHRRESELWGAAGARPRPPQRCPRARYRGSPRLSDGAQRSDGTRCTAAARLSWESALERSGFVEPWAGGALWAPPHPCEPACPLKGNKQKNTTTLKKQLH